MNDEPRGWRDVVDVFTQAARGLAAAHATGIVHRDFKPENVLLDEAGRVKVTDFGLARADERDREPRVSMLDDRATDVRSGFVTEHGAVLGTPAYMAPEQIMGRGADVQSDQFSFCVALWEALFCERPFEGRSMVELAIAVTKGRVREPPVGSLAPSWLRRIAEHGLAVDPQHRWPSMASLCHALGEGAKRRQTRIAVAVGGVLVFGGLAAWVGVELRSEMRRASCGADADAITSVWNDDEKRRLRDALIATGVSYAPSAFEHAVPYLDSHAEGWRSEYARLCIATMVDRTRTEPLWAASRYCLGERRLEVASLLEVLIEEADPSAVHRAVEAVAGLAPLATCRDDAWLLDNPAPERDDATAELLRMQLWRADGLREAGKFDDAFALAQVVAADAEAAGLAHTHRAALLLAGYLAVDVGASAESEQLLAESFDASLRAGESEDARAAAAALVFTAVGAVQSRPEEALVWGRVARGLGDRLGIEADLTTAALEHNLAQAHAARGSYTEAQQHGERALDIREQALGPEHPDVGGVLRTLANILSARASFDEALPLAERALEIAEQAQGADHPAVSSALVALAGIYGERGSYAEAQSLYERATKTSPVSSATLRASTGPAGRTRRRNGCTNERSRSSSSRGSLTNDGSRCSSMASPTSTIRARQTPMTWRRCACTSVRLRSSSASSVLTTAMSPCPC